MADSELFCTITSVQQDLISITKNENIMNDIERCISCWDYNKTLTLDQLKEDIKQAVIEIKEVLFPGNTDMQINKLIYFVVSWQIYDFISFIIHRKFSKDDFEFYEYSKKFCNKNGTPNELGSTFYNVVPNSAIVELSMLNTKRTVFEKLQCLYSVYDYVFVDIKSALISLISKYSEKEFDIPIINNKEVVPVLMAVILKSKLFYLISDIYFIREFGSDILKENDEMNKIYKIFEECIHKIWILRNHEQDLEQPKNEGKTDKVEQNLNVCETIDFVQNMTNNKEDNRTILDEENKRIAMLIVSATTDNLTDIE
ncbi:uncharacterized protein LOC143191034 isoform X1 [Rhynchophorus ferrugineus]|uniref:uncharacterized protein LOC143191034 isoform X1 n=3 Tax=Rhynchophorus ferrugineus TaxID=354439 RepID=UPI003FCD2C4A